MSIRYYKYLATVDSQESGIVSLIINNDNRLVAIPAKYLPKVDEGDIVEVSFTVKNKKRKQDKDEIIDLIKELQDN